MLLQAILDLPEAEREAMQAFFRTNAEMVQKSLPQYTVEEITGSLLRLFEKGCLEIGVEGDRVWLQIKGTTDEEQNANSLQILYSQSRTQG